MLIKETMYVYVHVMIVFLSVTFFNDFQMTFVCSRMPLVIVVTMSSVTTTALEEECACPSTTADVEATITDSTPGKGVNMNVSTPEEV